MNGHPDNPLGPGRLATDAVDALAAAQPNFPCADYDIEDQGDRDGDGNVFEPDGVVDHLVLVHSGEDKSGGGGAQGVYAIWAHSSAVAGGHTIPGTGGLKVSNYIVQPEDSGVGVFSHEYGHDLGLPDLYDTSGAADSDVDFWDLMASGSHTGAIFQATPTHMGLWDKWVLGWADPLMLNPGASERDVQLGQTSLTPRGTRDGVKINLPNKVITLAEPHSGANMWYSGADQDWADVRLSRQVAVPNANDAKFWMWNNYIAEEDWDFGFVEVSTDGNTWSELKVFDEAGNLVSTDDNYPDPNGRMADYGGKKYGLTGDSHGWRHDYVDLSGYAGQTIQLRLRLATDAAFLERGWFADDFSVTGGGQTTFTDDVEGGANGWTNTVSTFTDTTGAGWHFDSGTQVRAHYYLAEWRNQTGFDVGLKYAYDTTYSHDAWKVERAPYNAPGMLVWYRDTTYGNNNHVTANLTALPSYGSKGGLLIVDSHFDPFRRQGVAAQKDPSTLDNIPSRPQSSNAAFTLHPTYLLTGDRHLAEDLLQDTLIRAAERWRSMVRGGEPEPYVRRMLYTRAVDGWRRRRRHGTSESIGDRRVVRVASDGTRETIGVDIPEVRDVDVAPDGTVYVIGGVPARVIRIAPDGSRSEIAAQAGPFVTAAHVVRSPSPGAKTGVTEAAVDADGTVFVLSEWRIWRLQRGGQPALVAGSLDPGAEVGNGDGGPADHALLRNPYALAVTPTVTTSATRPVVMCGAWTGLAR